MKNSPYLWCIALFLSGLILVTGCEKQPTKQASMDAGEQSVLKSSNDIEALGSQSPFAFVHLFIEYNSTAGDAGIQIFFDGEAWKWVKILNQDGDEEILEIESKRGLKELGLTELYFESAEPSLSEVLALFPAGNYKFWGRALDGDRLVSTATLSHDIPAAPSFSPSNGESVDRNNTIIKWDPIPGVASYQVTVGNEELGVMMTVDLLPSSTSLLVPPTFLAPGRKYNAEVLAISPNGNRTITEGTFNTPP